MQTRAPILVIDDDPLIRYMLSTALKSQGLSPLEAVSGEEGTQVV